MNTQHKPNCFHISEWLANSKTIRRLTAFEGITLVRDSFGEYCLFVDGGDAAYDMLIGRLVNYKRPPSIRTFYELCGFDWKNEDEDFFSFYYDFFYGVDYED